jgi:hypothetical protein
LVEYVSHKHGNSSLLLLATTWLNTIVVIYKENLWKNGNNLIQNFKNNKLNLMFPKPYQFVMIKLLRNLLNSSINGQLCLNLPMNSVDLYINISIQYQDIYYKIEKSKI